MFSEPSPCTALGLCYRFANYNILLQIKCRAVNWRGNLLTVVARLGIYVRRDLVDELRTLSLANPGVPVVYLPLHRSHLDYILLTYILWLHDMRLPQVRLA